MILNRYQVVSTLGKGSFSHVYQCLDLRKKQMVSIKVRAPRTRLSRGRGGVRGAARGSCAL